MAVVAPYAHEGSFLWHIEYIIIMQMNSDDEKEAGDEVCESSL